MSAVRYPVRYRQLPHGPGRVLVELHRELHLDGYAIAARNPVKRLADCLNYETAKGRARRVERGVYTLGIFNPAERRRVGNVALTPSATKRRD